MRLTVAERITALSLLPEKGSFVTLRVINDDRMNLSFTEEEHKRFQFQDLPNGGIRWNVSKNPEDDLVDISLTDITKEAIKKTLKELDEKEQLENRHFSLYEKLVIE